MATDPSFADYVTDLASSVAGVRTKKMFGEYGLFVGDKMVGVLCDGQAFLKDTDAGRALLDEVVLAPPFTGAKDYLVLDAALDDRDLFAQLLRATEAVLPAPKPKKAKTAKGASEATPPDARSEANWPAPGIRKAAATSEATLPRAANNERSEVASTKPNPPRRKPPR